MSDVPGSMVRRSTRAEPGATAARTSWQSKALNELRRLAGMLAYLWVFFGVLALSQYLGLAEHQVNYRFYGVALVNALLVVKVLLLADDAGFARRFDDGPLAAAVLYRALAFAVLLVAFYVVEEIGIGAWRGRTLAASTPHFATGAGGLLAVTTVMFVGLIPFFAYAQLGRLLGPTALHDLVFRPRPDGSIRVP